MEPGEEETVVQTPAYHITRRRAGEFLIVRVAGKFADALLDDFRSRVFVYKTHYGLDLSGLAGVNPALARELKDTAAVFRAGEKRLVLINPPPTLRSLVAMGGGTGPLEMVLSEDQIVPRTAAVDDSAAHTIRELERVQKELRTNRHWQFVDQQGRWVCPFCGKLQEEVRIQSALSVTTATVEKAYRHIWSKCPSFKPSGPQLRPLAELQDALRRANQETVIVPRGKMERLESEVATLKGKTEELEESVRRASERQRRLLPPKAPDVAGTEIDLIYRPAAVVSGDFYDFVPLDDGKVAFLVGDVSGHGIEAGIVMGMAKKVLSIRLQDFPDPVEALARTNDDVDRELGRVSFVTVFVGVYDPATRRLTCLRAGHNPPLLFNPKRPGRSLEIKPDGLGLGILPQPMFGTRLKTIDVDILPGDVLLLYTDGLVEARNADGEQFGEERTLQVLGSTFGYTPALVLSELAGTLDSFTGNAESEDDITAVCVRFR